MLSNRLGLGHIKYGITQASTGQGDHRLSGTDHLSCRRADLGDHPVSRSNEFCPGHIFLRIFERIFTALTLRAGSLPVSLGYCVWPFLPGDAIKIALKETSLAGSKIYIGGSGSNNKDIQLYAKNDLMIAAIAAFVLIFLIMMIITRSLVAALVIPGTVAFSYAGAFGLSVLIWQHLIGLPLHWLILPLTFIVLVAVGSDYNLLLVARLKEEIHAGLNTGLIRALGSTGGVVTSAGLVFAFTMLAMLSSDLRTIGQMGSTVCIGLLLDTLVVRSFIVPCLVRLLGPWFWWPTLVRTRPPRRRRPATVGPPKPE